MLLVTAHAEVAAVAIPCDPVSPAQCRDPVLYLSVAWLGSTSDNTAAPTMVRLTLSAADMTVCYDPSDSTACSSTCLQAAHLQPLSFCNSTAAHSWITAQPSLCSQVLAAGTCLQAAHLQPLSFLQQHSSSQLDHSTTLTLQSGACCRHLSTSSTLAATQLLATAQQLTAGSQHNPHSAVRCLLQALVYSSNLQPLSSLLTAGPAQPSLCSQVLAAGVYSSNLRNCSVASARLVIHSPVICFRCD